DPHPHEPPLAGRAERLHRSFERRRMATRAHEAEPSAVEVGEHQGAQDRRRRRAARTSGRLTDEPREVAERRAVAALEAQARGFAPAPKRAGGDEVRVAGELADDESPAWPQDAGELADGRFLIGDLAEDRDQD